MSDSESYYFLLVVVGFLRACYVVINVLDVGSKLLGCCVGVVEVNLQNFYVIIEFIFDCLGFEFL